MRAFRETVLKKGQILGYEDPDTLMAMNKLALIYQDQGSLGEAVRIHEEVLARRRAKRTAAPAIRSTVDRSPAATSVHHSHSTRRAAMLQNATKAQPPR